MGLFHDLARSDRHPWNPVCFRNNPFDFHFLSISPRRDFPPIGILGDLVNHIADFDGRSFLSIRRRRHLADHQPDFCRARRYKAKTNHARHQASQYSSS